MLRTRYGRVFAWSIPAGAAIGILFGISVYLIGDMGDTGDLWGLFSLLIAGALLGALTAVAAGLGAWVALLIWDKTLTRRPAARVAAAAIGAALGAIVLWMVIGVVNSVASTSGWAWFPIAGFLAAVTAPISAVVSGLLVYRADKRAVRDATPAAPRPIELRYEDPDDEVRIDLIPRDRAPE